MVTVNKFKNKKAKATYKDILNAAVDNVNNTTSTAWSGTASYVPFIQNQNTANSWKYCPHCGKELK